MTRTPSRHRLSFCRLSVRTPSSLASFCSCFTGIRGVFDKFLKFGDGETDATMVNNDEWLNSLKYLEFLRYAPSALNPKPQTLNSLKYLEFLRYAPSALNPKP